MSGPALAQSMPGMGMPMPVKTAAKKPAAKKGKPAVKMAKPANVRAKASKPKSAKAKAAMHKYALHRKPGKLASMPGMTMPVDHAPMGRMSMPAQPAPMDRPQMGAMPGITMPAQPAPGSVMNHGGMAGMAMPMGDHGGHTMAMTGALGSYPMERESSGTAWQPDSSRHSGIETWRGDWMLMAHGVVNLVGDTQSGPSGDDKLFASGMLMGMARRPMGSGTLQLKAMASPDPLMGGRGYPLLLASGETANGRDRLVNRQHPHDLFMELSGSVSQSIGPKSSLFLYGGLPGEPAFGPPAFMHREAIMDSPEAPITHHWLDSTHITFGVVTAGLVLDRVKIEASRFNGREPDQHRWNIETGPLDSSAVRLSWNPSRTLSLQGSWGRFVDPEQLEPGVNQTRWSASALWADEVASGWRAAATLAWGRKSALGHNDDGWATEGSLTHAQWTLFGRAELVENRELTDAETGPAYRVGKASAGAVRDFRISEHLSAGLGGLLSVNFVPDALAPSYGGKHPTGAMGFVRLKLD